MGETIAPSSWWRRARVPANGAVRVLLDSATSIENSYRLAVSLKETGDPEGAALLMDEVANWNFNSAWFAMLRSEAAEG